MAVLIAAALLANGLAAGVLMGTVLGGVPLLLSLPPERYLETHRFLANRYEPFQPLCMLATLACDVALAVIGPAAARPLFAASALLILAVVAISAGRNVPIKRWAIALDPAHLPGEWSDIDPRRRWARWNTIRTAAAVLAFALNVLAATLLR